MKMIWGRRFRISFGDDGDQVTLPEQQETKEEGKPLWNVDLGGGEDVIAEDIEEVVGDERLELREDPIQMVRKQDKNEERNVLMAMALMGEFILDHCQVILREIKTRTQLLNRQF